MPTRPTSRVRRTVAASAALAVPLSLLALGHGAVAGPADPAAAAAGAGSAFHRTATYPVFLNVPAGVDPAAETVAEISAVTEDGNTVVYTDAAGKRVGFLDITDPQAPKGLGSIDLATVGNADDQPTSVAVVGPHLLVVVDTSGGSFTAPSGRLDVFTLADRQRVASHDLGGQPDSIAISPDGAWAAVAIENQRDEEFTPAGGAEGDLPQPPAGFVQVVDLKSAPQAWVPEPVALTSPDGSALPMLVEAGLDTPTDPEPEYVDINADNQVAVTLQENNGVVVIDLPSRTVRNAFSAGTAGVDALDVKKDGLFDRTGSITAPREPDAIAWIGNDRVATANEGDWKGGTRGWTIFDAGSGSVVWDAGNSVERIADRVGLHNEDRAGKKGVEPEGLTVTEIGGKVRAFVGSERSNFVAVYDLTDSAQPVLEQVLPTTNGPEGLLPVPARDLLVISSEVDEAADGVRATVSLYRHGAGTPRFPQIESAAGADGLPVGWGALGALAAHPTDRTRIYAASDSAYATGRIHTVDVSTTPARILDVVEVTDSAGANPKVDIEGLTARADGGWWAAVEGTTGGGNQVLRLAADGVVEETVPLPDDVAAHVGKWGLEGVTSVTTKAGDEQLFVALQRPLWKDPADLAAGTVDGDGVVRIGRYDVSSGTWSWFGYQLESTSVEGDWLGLSEIVAVDRNTLAVIERDKLNGPAAAVKRIYTVDVPKRAGDTLRVLPKRLALDALPRLRRTNGWTQEKLEGLTVSAGFRVFAVTDNDGVKDATGETVFLRLGTAARVFRDALATTTRLRVPDRRVRSGERFRVVVKVPGVTGGKVRLLDGRKRIKVVTLKRSRLVLRVSIEKVGTHRLRAVYVGTAARPGSRSKAVTVRVRR